MATRSANASWNGTLTEGDGTMQFGGGAFGGLLLVQVPRSRRARGRTPRSCSPRRTQAASRWRWRLASSRPATRRRRSRRRRGPPESERRGGFEINRIDLHTRGRVPGIDADGVPAHRRGRPSGGCPVSKALAAVGEINLDATARGLTCAATPSAPPPRRRTSSPPTTCSPRTSPSAARWSSSRTRAATRSGPARRGGPGVRGLPLRRAGRDRRRRGADVRGPGRRQAAAGRRHPQVRRRRPDHAR